MTNAFFPDFFAKFFLKFKIKSPKHTHSSVIVMIRLTCFVRLLGLRLPGHRLSDSFELYVRWALALGKPCFIHIQQTSQNPVCYYLWFTLGQLYRFQPRAKDCRALVKKEVVALIPGNRVRGPSASSAF